MKGNVFAVFLHLPPHPTLSVILDGYLHSANDVIYLFADKVEHVGAFLLVGAFRASDKSVWDIQIPISSVVSIADMSRPTAPPGFVSDALKRANG